VRLSSWRVRSNSIFRARRVDKVPRLAVGIDRTGMMGVGGGEARVREKGRPRVILPGAVGGMPVAVAADGTHALRRRRPDP
jgi:hypothetical protein